MSPRASASAWTWPGRALRQACCFAAAPLKFRSSRYESLSHAHQPQLVKMPGTRRRQDVLALRHHDALALKVGNCAAQYRRLHVVDLGFELSA